MSEETEENLCGRCTEASKEVGETVWCTVCPSSKAPRGRSAPIGAYYCDQDCEGYYQDPRPTSLWPGESRLEFGYGGVMTQPCTCDDSEGGAA